MSVDKNSQANESDCIKSSLQLNSLLIKRDLTVEGREKKLIYRDKNPLTEPAGMEVGGFETTGKGNQQTQRD